MRPRILGVALVGLALIGGVSPIAAQKGRSKLTEVSGTTTIACVDDQPRSVSPGDGICGDAFGPYYDGTDGVESDLREGDREFRLWHLNTVRHLTVRFPSVAVTAPVQGFECVGAACASAGRVLDRVIATDVGPDSTNAGANTNLVTAGNVEVTGGLTSIPINSTIPQRSRLVIGFPDPDGHPYRWAIYFNPAAYPETSLVNVTRTAQCTWIISTASGDAIGGLIVFGQGRGKATKSFEGRFSMPFTMTFTAASCS